MKLYYVYILKCRNGSYYVGHTDNLEKRLSEHHQGIASFYTAPFDYTQARQLLPIKLVYKEEFQTRKEAFITEQKLKKWNREKKEIVINQGWEALAGYSKRKKL